MSTKRISMVAMAALMVLALSAVHAEAGVGGCRRIGRCGGFEAATVKQAPDRPTKPSFLDSLSWILPADVIAAGKAVVDRGRGHKDPGATTEGVGGCRRFGCGSGSGQ